MRVLVTGSAGRIGRTLVSMLRESGYEIRTFDRTAQHKKNDWEHFPGDLRDIHAVRRAAEGMDAIAHLGAIPSDHQGAGDDVLSVNVQGTWNVLFAAAETGVERVVYFSSINALGIVGGHSVTSYFPIDDNYPNLPLSPYQLSKHLAEEACRSFSAKYGFATLCLRPVGVTHPDIYAFYKRFRVEDRMERGKREYWAYVDVRDVCSATLYALKAQDVRHDVFLLSAADTSLPIPTNELVDRYYPDIPWVGQSREEYLANNPHRSLLDCSRAHNLLGWKPAYNWRNELALLEAAQQPR
jgi:nucleoside-diphosphate-sugar epimerase